MPPDRSINVLDQQVEGTDFKLLMLSINGRAVGSCQIAGWNEPQPSIVGIVVDPQHRRRGHATALIREAIAIATRDRKNSLTLTVEKENTEAIKLYRSLGFVTDLADPVQLWMSIPTESVPD